MKYLCSKLFLRSLGHSQDTNKWESNTKIIPEAATWCKTPVTVTVVNGNNWSQMWINMAYQVSFSCLYSVFLLTVYHDPLHKDSIINKCVCESLCFCFQQNKNKCNKFKWLLRWGGKKSVLEKKTWHIWKHLTKQIKIY